MLKTFVLLFAIAQNLNAASNTDLTIGITQEWSSLNPISNQLASNEALFPFLIRDLVRRSADGTVIPDVAESIPKLDPKTLTAVWKIKSNAKWGDGKPLVCADLHLSWQAGLNPKVSVASRSIFDKIKNITWNEKQPQTCTFTYATFDWGYDRELPPFVPSHIEKPIYEKHKNDPEGYDRNSTYVSNPTHPALYNGPYVVTEFKIGSHFIMSTNPHFFGKKPQIAKVTVKLISDTNALKANLSTGQINTISAVGFPPDTAISFETEFSKTNAPYKVRFQNSGIIQGIYFNLDKEIFKDPIVREALARSIDKEGAVKAFFNNQLESADGVLAPTHPLFKKREKVYSVRKANELLDKAGWKLNKNGVREKDGKVLNFVFKTSAGLKVLENIQVYACEQFKQIGAQCSIKNEPPRILLGQSVPRGEFDLTMFGMPFQTDTSVFARFRSDEIPTSKNSWAGVNSIRLNSPEMDKLAKTFEAETQRAKRDSLAAQIEETFMKNYYLIPLYHRREAFVFPKAIKGVSDSFEGTTFTTPENWTF